MSIVGGLGSTPFKGDDEGVFISRVTAGGPADEAGLKVNDKVISVNGISCVNVDHYEAVGILKVPDFCSSLFNFTLSFLLTIINDNSFRS